MVEELELVSLFRGSIGKVLNFLLTCEEENSKSAIARGADVTFKTVSDIWPFLERHEIIVHTRTIGMAKMYSLNKDNRIVGQLRKIKHEINNHNHNNKGLSEIFSVYGFLLLLTLPLLGTVYFASNESTIDVSNWSLINITTLISNDTNATNVTEILVNGTIESIILPLENTSEPSDIIEINGSEALLNITSPESTNVTEEPMPVIETMVEEIAYRHESIEIGQRVQWYRQIKTHGGNNYTVGLNLPLDYQNLAMVDAIGNYTLDNGTLILSGEHDIQMSFTTSPVEVSEQILSESPYEKKVIISSQSTLHYTNVGVSVSIPEKTKLTIIEMPGKEIIDDPKYNVTLRDTDGNGKADTLSWIVPQLSSKEYLIQDTMGKKPEGITFDRSLDCPRCGQHKAPPVADVNMTISAAFPEPMTNVFFSDYFPVEWSVADPNGGTVESYNASHNRISWHYDSITESASQWYIIKSPAPTTPPTEYDFLSGIGNVQSEPWTIIVSDTVTLTGVTISGVANTYRGDYDTVTCSVTETGTGGNIVVYVSLQYNNGTTGGWVNVTDNNVFNVSQLDANPQSQTGKVSFDKTFTVLAMRTGSGNQFRCNASGDATPHYFISSTSAMTIITPSINISRSTDVSPPISLTNDQSDNFNLTCGASTPTGNVSSLTMFAQWNSTNNVWNNFSTSAGNLRADQNTPVIYSTVDSTAQTTTFLITGWTAGSYSVRCFANSSNVDGRLTNSTSIVAVNVAAPPTVSLLNVTLGNVSNIYRGDRDFDIFCNATSDGGSVTANVSLQYNNGTIGSWINLNETNWGTSVSYNKTEGTNPRWNQAITTTSTIFKFGVFANWTGSPQFRCNVSQGPISNPVKVNLSTVSSMTILAPPLNTSLNTTPYGGISIPDDWSTNFNMTCNVSTLRGNATNVTVYAQWNSTANVWNNFTTTTSDALYANETSPLNFINIDNSTPSDGRTFLIRGTTPGSYSVRCYANSSAQSGSDVNWTGIIPVSVVHVGLENVTIGNVSNIYRGDTDEDIFCNATSTGGSVTANVTLQFQNATGWYTLNGSFNGGKVAYVADYGTNPRWGTTVTTTGTIVRFSVFANWTGNQVLRCNVTKGGLGSSTQNTSSTATLTINAPLLNTSIDTDPAAPINIYDDQSNNFNLTCNVTALAGNASSVTLYVQWNSTVGAWNFTNNTGGPMRINETTPIVFSNVDNSSWATEFRTFNVTGYTNGNYAARCYTNSSDRDGLNTNGSSIVAVSITAAPVVSNLKSITTDKIYYINGTDTGIKIKVNITPSTTELPNASLTRPDGSMTALGTLVYNSTSGFYEGNYSLVYNLDNMPGDYRVNVSWNGSQWLNYTSFLYMSVQGINNIGVLTSRTQLWDAYRGQGWIQVGFAMHELVRQAGFLNSYLLSPKLVENMNLSNFSAIIVSYLPAPLWTENLTNKLRNFSNNGGLLFLFGNISAPMQDYAGVKYNKTEPEGINFNLTRNAIANSTILSQPLLDTDFIKWTGVYDEGGVGMFSLNLSCDNVEGSTAFHPINKWNVDIYNTTGASVLYNMTQSDGTYRGVGITINSTVVYSPLPLTDLYGAGVSWSYNNTALMQGPLNPYGDLFDVFLRILEYKLAQDDTFVKSWLFPEEAYIIVTMRHDDDCTGYESTCSLINNTNMNHSMTGPIWMLYGNTSLTAATAALYRAEGNEIGYHVVSSLNDKSTLLIGMENMYGITIYTFSDHGDGSNDKGIDSLLSKESYRHGPNAALQTGYLIEGTATINPGRNGIKLDPLFVWWNKTTWDVSLYPRLRVQNYDSSVGTNGAGLNNTDPTGLLPSYQVAPNYFHRRNYPFIQLVHPVDVSTGSKSPAYNNLLTWFASWERSNGNYTPKELSDWYDARANVTYYINTSDSSQVSYVVTSPALVQNFTWVIPWKSGWNATNINVSINGADKTDAANILNASLYNGSKDYLMFMTNVSAGQSTITVYKPPAGSLYNISIGNVSTIYRGDTDDDIYCNATSISGSAEANVTLQFQNATGWYTLNESFNGGKVAYVADYGTNPRWGTTVTTAGTIVRFSVFGNWTSGQVLRCNVTQGTLDSSKVNVSSTATLTINAPLLNTTMATDLTPPISLYSDGTNNFNMTCNVSALVGNASSVTLYPQWNQTAGTWNPLNTTSGPMLSNESGPIVFSNVDNSSRVNENRTFQITGSTASSYSVRCYSNSSDKDGGYTNSSGIAAVNVVAPAPSLYNVTAGNVSNIYRGDTDNVVFCNATSVNGNVVANITLQYNNGSVGGWINLNETNRANNVSYIAGSYGTNPRYGQTVATTGIVVRFGIYGNITGDNYFRCNVTTGSIGSPVATNTSLSSLMTVLAPPLNTSLTSDLASPIYLQAGESNNFNLTCNVSALRGNASSVRLYVQWNTTADVWNNVTNVDWLNANESTPVNLSDVDNSSQRMRVFRINASVQGNYSIRCYAVSSGRDGSNGNKTNNMVAVSVNLTNNSFYTVLYESYSDRSRGTAVYGIINPNSSSMLLNESFINFYMVGNTSANLTHQILVGNVSNYSYQNDSGDWLNDTVVTYLPLTKKTLGPRENATIMIRATWVPDTVGGRDWIAFFNYSGTMYSKSEWAWWNASELFYDEFTDTSNWVGQWGTKGGNWNISTSVKYNGTSSAEADKVIGGKSIAHAESTVGYANINVSFWTNTTANDAGEGLNFSYWNGTNWKPIYYQQGDTASWNYSSFLLPSDAENNADFKVNISCTNNQVAESCYVDTFRILGTPFSLLNVTIGNVSTIYRGDRDDDIYCNATSIVGSVNANVTLQFQNTTGWYTLNESFNGGKVAYVADYGTNPRWGETITTSGTIVRFSVFGNWTGNQVLRCNVTQGTLGGSKVNTSSTASLQISAPILNTSIETDLTPPISLADDGSDNFNLTCNVSTLAGNASSVTLYAQWNSTAGTWNPLNTTSGPMRSNESGPIVFSNVDNVTPDTRVFMVTGATAGSYSMRCYANSSTNDGPNTNGSGIIVVNVVSKSLKNVTIGNVSNTYRGDRDADIFCNATSENGNVQANVSLQYLNGSNWINVNESNWGGRISYDNSQGTNPRWGTIVTTTGTIVKFAVFANWTGNAQFRCNVSQGSISNPVKWNISSAPSMTVLTPPLNTTIETVPGSPITLYNDESNNFNLTCNVSTERGNASNVTLYAQWNTTVDVWNNFSASGSLKANETSPLNFSGVDNSTPKTRVFRINSSTIGSYSVRCYANSSGNDGSNENWTNIVAVNVVSASSLANVTIGNVSDIYRGDTDDDIFCNASSSGASLTANVSLQYNNGTIGGWIYLNETNKAVNVSYIPTYGTNPRWNFLTTTAGNSTRFAVYGNWTGSGNQFRCNVTTGPLSSPTGGNLSTNDAFMTILAPPLNTSIQTVPSANIILYTDESNNLNMTCNVSTVIGNASSATVYAQWNSTVGVWNPLNSTSGPMRANESSPIVFSNVDNVTPDTRVFRINSSVPGLYSVRCFANSSDKDGSNQNWTGIIAVNVSVPVSAISPEETIVDRDSVSASTPDYIMLNVSTNYTIDKALNITFKANLTSPIGGQTNLVLGTNATNSLGYAVLYWDPNVSFYAGNYTWWGEANVSYAVNRTKTVLVYGGFNLTFQSETNSPESSYVLGQNVTINATLRSLGPESVLQLNTSYLAKFNSTIIAEDSTTRLAYLNYSTTIFGNWTGNYTLASGDPLSGNPYNVSLNTSANFFFTNTTNFSRSFEVLTNVTVSITLYEIPINYGNQNPGDTVSANVGAGFPMIISVDSITNVNTDVYIKSNETNMTGQVQGMEIMVQNVTFANNSLGTDSMTLSTGYQLLKSNISVNFTDGTNVSAYWWMYVPQTVVPDTYENHIVVVTNQSA